MLLLAALLAFAPRPHPAVAHVAADSIDQKLRAALTPLLADLTARDQFSGVVLIAHNGTTVFSQVAGMADQEHHLPNTIDTRFNIGSMDKMFTGIAIAQLVERGKVSLDATIGRYLPEYPNADVRARVTVRQLLTHTSGLGSYFQRGYLRDRIRIDRASDLLRFFAEDTLDFAPGTKMSYSNAGYAVLGAIIENVSGQTYFDYVQQHIFAPAGMTSSGFFDASRAEAGRAIGYSSPPSPNGAPGSGPRQVNLTQVEVRGGPAGGGFSTAHDMVAFGRALWSGKLASRSTIDLFTTGVMPMAPSIKYGFGFGDLRVNGVRAVGHNGGAPGANAEFDSYPDLGYDVIVLSNYDPPVATTVIRAVRDVLMGK